MPRYKALAALAFLGVLISAGSVGSQDPFLARSEAESAATATPVPYNPNAKYRVPAEPVADHAPRTITPPADATIPSAAPRSETPAPALLNESANEAAAIKLAMSHQTQMRVDGIVLDRLPAMTPTLPTLTLTPTLPTPTRSSPTTNQKKTPAVEAGAVALTQSGFTTLELDDSAQRSSVAERRMLATVPDEIEPYFDLFMYVGKSTRGPLAQRMFVFQRDADGNILPYAEWRISTGREKLELHHEQTVRTTTPEGVFVLDPKRFYPRYWSRTWDGAPMHHAMFYDMQSNGRISGLAIHAAFGAEKIRQLGKRDSAGCIRLSPKQAKELFYKIQNTTQGRIPAFAINEKGSTDRWGHVQHDETGALMMQDGYRAVLFVENYDGREEVLGPVVAYTQ